MAHEAVHGGARATRCGWRGQRAGQSTVEFVMVFTLLLTMILFLVQTALYMHARNVVTGAAQDGARVASASNGSVERGVTHARSLVRGGLGGYADGVIISGGEGGGRVVVETNGGLPLLLPWFPDTSLPLRARAEMEKERFRVDTP